MTGHGKQGKPKAGFPCFPPPLEIATRFPHSHNPGYAWKSGKPKTGFPLSHLSFSLLKTNPERRLSGGSLRSRLQAHSSMRKCCVSALAWQGTYEILGDGQAISTGRSSFFSKSFGAFSMAKSSPASASQSSKESASTRSPIGTGSLLLSARFRGFPRTTFRLLETGLRRLSSDAHLNPPLSEFRGRTKEGVRFGSSDFLPGRIDRRAASIAFGSPCLGEAAALLKSGAAFSRQQ